MRLVLIVLSALLLSVSAQECDLDCGGRDCIKEDADFTDHQAADGSVLEMHRFKTSKNGYHCKCADNETGLKCKRKFISCYDDSHKCYHGGKCLEIPDDFGNEQHYCDCNDAKDDDGIEYIGKYCEIAKPHATNIDNTSIDICGDDDKGAKVFCVNNATCRDDWADRPNHPCQCGSEFEGKHCEFPKGKVPDCTLDCGDHGHCRLGIKTYAEAELGYDNFWKNSENAMYCECNKNHFGVQCEVKGTDCNDHHCFNGAECTAVEQKDGTVINHCDCSKADSGGKKYGGQYCQYEASDFCKAEGHTNGNTFCVNGGDCAEFGPHDGCVCKAGFHGPICEFEESVTPKNEGYSKCNINCENQGTCKKGKKDTSFFSTFGINLSHLANITHDENFEHCVCPPGFAGLRCEIDVKTCEGGAAGHICLHGGTCTREDGQHACDCDNAHNALDKFAGVFCQFRSTHICTPDDKPGLGRNKFAFCVNGGTCKGIADHNEEHHGCDCPNGFTGAHCEIHESDMVGNPQSNDTPSGSDGGSNVGAIVGSITAIAVAGVLVAAIFYRKRSHGKEPIEIGTPEQSAAGPVVDVGPEKDFDGNELENVEII